MTHEEETLSRWNEIERLETAYDRWESFFRALVGRPRETEALCELGLLIVRGEARLGPRARRNVEQIVKKSLDIPD